jgi:manganese/zinc/iron transport system ATP- binding protein
VAIHVRNVTVAYESKPVLRSVTLDIMAGRVVGIVGPNGAGKSTLLKIIMGLIRPDSGTVLVRGLPIDAVRHRVAYVPQTEAVDWDFPVTAAEVVLMGRYATLGWFGRPSAEDRRLADEALERVGMREYARRHIRRLSGGQQKRVFLARAMCQGAEVMLLDEPFAGVDAATERAIFELIRAESKRGRTLVVVNHDLNVLDRFDDLLLVNQRVVAFGPVAQTATPENLRLTYGGRLSLLDRAEQVLGDAAVVASESGRRPPG